MKDVKKDRGLKNSAHHVVGDTRYVLRISKFVILTYKNNNNFIIILLHPAYCTALLLAKKFMM